MHSKGSGTSIFGILGGLWCVLDGTMHHSPFRRRWTGGTAAVNGMEERDRVDASTNLCSRPVAATGRRHLCHRPVDANRLCYFIFLTQVWLLLAGDISVLARLILLFYFLTQLWLLLAGDISVLARLILLFCFLTQPVAVTGRRKLHHRPVDLTLHY